MTRRARLLDHALIVLAVVTGAGSVYLLIAHGSGDFRQFGWPESTVLAWDTFLCALFFAQHSGMVRRPFRARLAAWVDPHYHGAIYAIASGIALALVVLLWQRSGTSLVVLRGIPRLIAAACSLLAALVFVLSASALGTFDPLGIGPIRAHLQEAEPRPVPFVVRGPYRWVRHPLYACILVMFWAGPDVTADRLLFNVLWTGWILAGTVLEERDLVREFGEVYRRYQKAVPMLIPWRGAAARADLGS